MKTVITPSLFTSHHPVFPTIIKTIGCVNVVDCVRKDVFIYRFHDKAITSISQWQLNYHRWVKFFDLVVNPETQGTIFVNGFEIARVSEHESITHYETPIWWQKFNEDPISLIEEDIEFICLVNIPEREFSTQAVCLSIRQESWYEYVCASLEMLYEPVLDEMSGLWMVTIPLDCVKNIEFSIDPLRAATMRMLDEIQESKNDQGS